MRRSYPLAASVVVTLLFVAGCPRPEEGSDKPGRDAEGEVADGAIPDTGEPDAAADTTSPETSRDTVEIDTGVDTGDSGADADDTGNSAPDSGPPLSPRVCRKSCQTPSDCVADDNQEHASNWNCTGGFCEFKFSNTTRTTTCTRDLDCIAARSDFERGCNRDSDCRRRIRDVCVRMGGRSYCARSPSSFATGSCPPSRKKKSVTHAQSGNTVDVCLNVDHVCLERQAVCVRSCKRMACPDGLVCTSDDECVCRGDQHCTETGEQRCYDGICGCDGQSDCDALGRQDDFTYRCD